MKPPNSKEILRAIVAAYHSLAEPDFRFVAREEAKQPYAKLIESLQTIFKVDELTDVNDDVAFFYELCGPQGVWILGLSMVGPYAMILRKHSQTSYQLVFPGHLCSTVEEHLIEQLHNQKIAILDQTILEFPVILRLQNTYPERTRFYQALFTDNDVLPWAKQ